MPVSRRDDDTDDGDVLLEVSPDGPPTSVQEATKEQRSRFDDTCDAMCPALSAFVHAVADHFFGHEQVIAIYRSMCAVGSHGGARRTAALARHGAACGRQLG